MFISYGKIPSKKFIVTSVFTFWDFLNMSRYLAAPYLKIYTEKGKIQTQLPVQRNIRDNGKRKQQSQEQARTQHFFFPFAPNMAAMASSFTVFTNISGVATVCLKEND